jgi:hypothetical protein
MRNSAWIALLRLMPPTIHGSLTLVTRIGQEIALQDIFRLEDDYAVFRGRMSGTTDAGYVFMMPYDEIHYLGFQKPMKEPEINAIFSGQCAPPETAEQRALEAADLTPPSAEPVPSAPPARPPEPKPVPAAAAEIPEPGSKAVLLERVRARLAASTQAKVAGTSVGSLPSRRG